MNLGVIQAISVGINCGGISKIGGGGGYVEITHNTQI